MKKYIWQQKNWPKFTWDESVLLPLVSEARLKQGQLTQQLTDLIDAEQKKAEAIIFETETITTASIEGEKYDPKSVRSSINRRLGLEYAGLPKTQRHIDGLVEVIFDATQNYDHPLDKSRLCSWHASSFPTGYSGLNQIRAGKYRNDKKGPMQVISGPIGTETIHYTAPPATTINSEMKQFLTWWQASIDDIDGILRAGIAHFHFITIHPFDDGNGRIARAITDMALAQDDESGIRYYSMSAEIVNRKREYYQILENSQQSTLDISPWLEWFITTFSSTLDNSKKLLANILSKAAYWRQNSQSGLNQRQVKVINKMLDVGKGNFKGGLTTKKYMNIAKVSRRTAIRDIKELIDQGMIEKNQGKGRNVNYDLAQVS
jgi:Fic family protein